MNDKSASSKTARIACLNDLTRKALGLTGRVVQTAGICTLSVANQIAIREKVETFDLLTGDNDPWGERDFGALENDGKRIFWKIDYYDRTLTAGSEAPSDPVLLRSCLHPNTRRNPR